jgi:hypothetical protein
MKISKRLKISASLVLAIFLYQLFFPAAAWALTGGPSQPEVESFEPIGTTDMVNLFSGDFTYNIPLLDVGGYPINLAYHSGVGMDQEASWVGLGWDLNPGVINRNMRGLPDDFDGDMVQKSTNIKPDETDGINLKLGFELAGASLDPKYHPAVTPNLGIFNNSYKGLGYEIGIDLPISRAKNRGSIGLGFNSQNGISIDPKLNFDYVIDKTWKNAFIHAHNNSIGVGANYNSIGGLKELTLGYSVKKAWVLFNHNFNQYNSKSHSSYSFANPTYTPQMTHSFTNNGSTWSVGTGLELFGAHPKFGLSLYSLVQQISDKNLSLPGYGYYYSQNGLNENALLDFNRENDIPYIKDGTSCLPLTNFTYDIYSVSGQGTGGMFRPFRSDVGVISDHSVKNESIFDIGLTTHIGLDLGITNIASDGLDFDMSFSSSESGKWVNDNKLQQQLPFIQPVNSPANNSRVFDIEPAYFKQAGEMVPCDQDFYDAMGDVYPTAAIINPDQSVDAKLKPKWTGALTVSGLHRKTREKRDAYMSFLTAEEASFAGLDKQIPVYPDNQFYSTQDLYLQYYTPVAYIDRMGSTPGAVPAQKWHMSELNVYNNDGTRYVYGIPVYNKSQEESAFNVFNMDTRSTANINCSTGLVDYEKVSGGYHGDNSLDNNKGVDNFYSGTSLPAYAHSYLLTGVLSPDYQDLTGNGISDDDLGSFVKFNYSKIYGNGADYKWRVPYSLANYSGGLRSDPTDDKGNYVYGTKEIYYVHSIESKNYVAIFKTSKRADSYGVTGHDGGNSAFDDNTSLRKLDQIVLYNKTDLQKNGITGAIPIKTVNFEYDYSLCPNVPNNSGVDLDKNGNPVSSCSSCTDGGCQDVNCAKGKLTLKRIYFTYGRSVKGQLSPYTFVYSSFNPSYDLKAYDRWGNYKPNTASGCDPSASLTMADNPYCEQNKSLADQYASAWSLSQIQTPAGGTINVSYEADDYAYVQDRRAMQMFQVAGMGSSPSFYATDIYPKGGGEVFWTHDTKSVHVSEDYNYQDNQYIYFKMGTSPFPPGTTAPTNTSEWRALINSNFVNPNEMLFYKYLVDLTGKKDYEYINGYCSIEDYGVVPVSSGSTTAWTEPGTGNYYGWVKIRLIGINNDDGGNTCNPIAKTAWNFTRQNLPQKIYHNNPNVEGSKDEFIKSLMGFGTQIAAMFTGFYRLMRDIGYSSSFVASKSFIRLLNPNMAKIGGGCRVKQLTLNDNWDHMNSSASSYNYGQTYDYTKVENGLTMSSGVAEYEPIYGNEENPFRKPIYYKNKHFLAPDDHFMIEEPLGESFFPSANVGYSRVTVRNLQRTDGSGNIIHATATGYSVNDFYTARDFPVLLDHTDMKQRNSPGKFINFLLKKVCIDNTAATQGYSIELNDMHGKPKMMTVYAENQAAYIHRVTYNYLSAPNSAEGNNYRLTSTVNVMNKDGSVVQKEVGKEIDFVMDMRQNASSSVTIGWAAQIDGFLAGILPAAIGSLWTAFHYERTRFRSAVGTKVIRRYGILSETIVEDENAEIENKNLIYDAESGSVLLSSTQNEFKDPIYSFTYPAHWAYDGMGQSYINNNIYFSDIKIFNNGHIAFSSSGGSGTEPGISSNLMPGDEVIISKITDDVTLSAQPLSDWFPDIASLLGLKHTTTDKNDVAKFWVYHHICGGASDWVLIDQYGNPAPDFIRATAGNITSSYAMKIIKSGRKNEQNAPIGQLTSLDNPVAGTNLNITNQRIIDASANVFQDNWKIFCCGRDYLPGSNMIQSCDRVKPCTVINPYLNDVYNNWRVQSSYVYIADRDNQNIGLSTINNTNIRTDGSYPFASIGGVRDNFWVYSGPMWVPQNLSGTYWQQTSEITKYSPYGSQALESKNPLNIYSSVLYGYNNSLPVASAENADYNQIAADGFEDYHYYESASCQINPHWNFLNNRPINDYITTAEKHTGQSSIQVTNTYPAVVYKNLVADPDPSCPANPVFELKPSDCIGTFAPGAGKYWISAWVKESGASVYTYPNSSIVIETVPSGRVSVYMPNTTVAVLSLTPSGTVINGWQKIEGYFTLSAASMPDGIRIKLVNSGSTTSYFDDIRIQPFNSTMKTFVYDPVTQKLLATLDENNYATIYEYDNEGNLTRIKKETINGLMTLQESRQANFKRQ